MTNFLLYITNTLVETDDKTKIATTYQLGEIGDLTTRFSNYSNKITVPKSPYNTALFGFSDNVQSNTDIPYKKLPAYLVNKNILH